jgi:hypothetical protein
MGWEQGQQEDGLRQLQNRRRKKKKSRFQNLVKVSQHTKILKHTHKNKMLKMIAE